MLGLKLIYVSKGDHGGFFLLAGFKTHCGLVTPYGDTDLGQHWLRKWLVAWRHQAITWTSVDLSSVRSSDIQLRAIKQEIVHPSIAKKAWKLLV